MYPISNRELSISALVEHWLRHREDKATAGDLMSELVQRFWKGELALRAPLGARPWQRGELLSVIRSTIPANEVEAVFEWPEPLPDPSGSMVFEFPPRLRLAPDPERWTEADLEAAYAAFAEWKVDQYPHHLLRAMLSMLVDRDDFAALCDRHGWPRPGFWFRSPWPSKGARRSRTAAQDYRNWLQQNVRSGAALRAKKDWCADALERFPGLTQGAFDNIWSKVAPPEWRKAGRRPNT
ncbi:MAG: hypothetical protein U1E45_23160 [Geminicoccaceae bacterium]